MNFRLQNPIIHAIGILASGLGLAADIGPLPDSLPYRTVDGVRFYSEVKAQPWRDKDDVIDGFDWSLPPDVKPSRHSMTKGFSGDPQKFPGKLLGVIDATWRELEPEEGIYDFSPIERGIKRLASKGFSGIELHVRGAVRDVAHFDADGKRIPVERLKEGQRKVLNRDVSAPGWLDKYGIPTRMGKSQAGTDDHIVNFDIFHPEYHSRYLKLVDALGSSGIPARPEISVCYIHMVSDTRGEENDGAFPDDPGHPQMVERLEAWARIFGPDRGKLMFTGHHPVNLRIAYDLGLGQRNGYVERYLLHTHNPALGQSMDPQGYLIVDESLPPITENRAFGDENEEYRADSDVHVARFGPRHTWPHRYREASLRTLQMRRNYQWEPSLSPDPYLTAYVANGLGRQVDDAPDAWCYLRESHVREHNQWKSKPVPVKNFERWLYQRDTPGYETQPAVKVDYHEPTEGFIMNTYAKGYNHDHVARSGKRIGLAMDDRFLPEGPQSVAVKITYYDDKPWKLRYLTAAGPQHRSVPSRGDGALRTATFFLNDAVFPAKGMDHDFVIEAIGDKATIRLVRVIKIRDENHPRVSSKPGASGAPSNLHRLPHETLGSWAPRMIKAQ